MIAIKINDFQYNIKNKLTLIQACLVNKIDIPRFCFHEKLSIAGNCRMCLVEDQKQIKPLASCAINASPTMNLYTNTVKVKKARESVLEFLLANHPLDCPVCDQGGECDLQDQSLVFGSDRGRFYEFKRSVEDKDCGPLIKTIMNRCIHCTRCVRFSNEIAGNTTLGVTGRGSRMEIGFYVEKLVSSELSGNIIDLCPVGALTSKPFAFTSRPWELKTFNSIDILDAMHSTIRIDVRGTKIMRILPRINENINDEWITDKIRFSYDGFRSQRIYNPMILQSNVFTKISWQKVLTYLKNFFIKTLSVTKNSVPIHGYLNAFSDMETVYVVKNFLSLTGSGFFRKSESFDQSFLNFSNTHIKQIQLADICLIVGENLRLKLPLLNAKIRSSAVKSNLPVYYIGHFSNYNYHIKQISTNLNTLISIMEGSHWLSVKISKQFSSKPLFIFTSSINLSTYFNHLKKFTNVLNSDWNGINLIQPIQNTSEFGTTISNNQNTFLHKFCIDIIFNYDKQLFNENSFKIYVGHHGDANAAKSNVVLPSASFIEKSTHYINIFGIVQKTKKVLFNVGDSRSDWQIIHALSSILNLNSENVHKNILQSMAKYTPLMFCKKKVFCHDGALLKKTFIFYNNVRSKINNYYLSDSISKNSKIMSLCANKFKSKHYNFIN